MIEIIKNFLFNAFILIGLITVFLALIWCMLELLNRIFKFTKYIIMYKTYKRNVELYSLKDKVSCRLFPRREFMLRLSRQMRSCRYSRQGKR